MCKTTLITYTDKTEIIHKSTAAGTIPANFDCLLPSRLVDTEVATVFKAKALPYLNWHYFSP